MPYTKPGVIENGCQGIIEFMGCRSEEFSQGGLFPGFEELCLEDSISVTDGEIAADCSTESPLGWGASGVWPAMCMNIPTNERQIQERLFQAFLCKNTLFYSSTIYREHFISIEANIFCHLTVEVTVSRSGLSVPY